jgi:dTDP-4-amino-4,6-dideoxygalactose transaminase
MNVPFVDLKAQYHALAQQVDQAMNRVLESSAFILGEDVTLFENEFAAYCQVAHCVGLDNGTSALELALRAGDIGPGDEVITAANTFIATASAIAFTDATPVLVDIDPRTYNLDILAVERALSSRTRAIIPVHLYGQPADMDPLLDLAQRKDLLLIEDACQAHGATYKGRRVGSLGDIACFSFYPAKNLGAYGDGGALVTNDAAIAEKIRMLRNYGQTAKYHHKFIAYNRRLDTLQAAILRIKLRYLDDWNARRAEHARLYDKLLANAPVTIPPIAGAVSHVYHLYVIRVQNRDALRAHLAQHGIASGIHYPVPIHLQEAYRHLGYGRGSFPITEKVADDILSLPMYPELTVEQITYVAEAVTEFARSGGDGFAVSLRRELSRTLSRTENRPTSPKMDESNMRHRPRVLVVPFAYNEGQKIRTTLSRFPAERDYDVLVMNDGSTDGSLDGVEAEFNVSVQSHAYNRGIGAAIKTIFAHAIENDYDIMVPMAGNNKDEPLEIPRLLKPILEDSYDFVQGSRFLPGGRYGDMPTYRILSTKVIHPMLFSLAVGKRVTESTNGFRAFRVSLLLDERINWRQDWLDRYELEPYLMYKVIRLGYKHMEVPVTKIYPPRQLGYTKMRPVIDWWSILRPIVYLRLGLKK